MNTFSFISNVVFIYRKIAKYNMALIILPVLQITLRVLGAVLQLYIPKVVLDGIEQNVLIATYAKNIIFVTFCMLLCRVFATWISNYLQYKSSQLNLEVFQRLLDEQSLNMDYGNYISSEGKNKQYKAIMSVDGWNGNALKDFHTTAVSFITEIIIAISYLVILTKLHFGLVIFMCLAYVVDLLTSIFTNCLAQKKKCSYADIDRKLGYMASIARDMTAAKDIRLYSMKSWIKFSGERVKNLKKQLDKKTMSERNFNSILGAFLVFLRDGVSYFYLLFAYTQGGLSVGDFSIYLTIINNFQTCLSSVFLDIGRLSNMNSSINDFRSFIEKSSGFGCEEIKESNVLDLEIRMEHVSFSYPGSKNKVLDDVTLTIRANEKLALVGANGAGKTTLIKLICGLITPDSGEIYLNNQNIKYIKKDDYFKLFSLVLQDISIFPASLACNITYQADENIDESILAESIERAGFSNTVRKLKNSVQTKLVKQIYNDAVELSGGEMQHLQLARAMYQITNSQASKASFLILDEPTAALDPISEKNLYEKFNSLTEYRTSIFISHRLASTKFCDKIVLLDGAKISEVGTHEELLQAGGVYAKMYLEQQKYYTS